MRIFETPLAPQSGLGRVIFGVLVAVLATAALLAWSPAHADDSEASEGREPVLPRRQQRRLGRPAAAEVDPGRRAHRRRHRRRHRDPALPQRRPAGDRGALRLPRLDARRRCTRMNVRLGERLLTAQDPREAAGAASSTRPRRRRARPTALLEQHRPNVFEMNVANILPGDEVAVELRYTELLVPQRRPLPASSFRPWSARATTRRRAPAGADAWVGDAAPARRRQRSAAAFEHQGGARHAAAGARRSRSPSHAHRGRTARRQRAGRRRRSPTRRGRRTTATSSSTTASPATGIEAGPDAVPGRGRARTSSSPWSSRRRRSPAAQINPRDYIFVVDISGSMHGFPLDTAKALLRAS